MHEINSWPLTILPKFQAIAINRRVFYKYPNSPRGGNMKNILLAGAFAVAATTSWAGNVSEPIMEAEIVMEEAVAAGGSDEWVGVLLTFLTIIVLGVGG